MEQLFSSPVQSDHGINGNKAVADECECDIAKAAAAASSARSPTCVIFAVDEQLGDVFRMPGHDEDDANAERRCPLEQVHQEGGTTGGRNVGPLLRLGGRIEQPYFLHPTRCGTPSYANQELVELSTLSNEESSSSSSDDCSSDDHRYLYLPSRRPRAAPLMSIFRPTSGTKRRCEFEEEDRQHYRSSNDDDDDDDDNDDNDDEADGCGTPTKRPSLRHANPVGSGEYGHDAHDAEISLSSTFSFASAFKRICRSSSSSSSFSSLLAAGEEGSPVFPLASTTIGGNLLTEDATAVSTMTIFKNLQHPLSSLAMTPFEDIEFRHNSKDDNERI